MNLENKRVTIGCFGIITDKKDRVLLCHRRDYDLWNLPGGGLEKNELPWDCTVREVKEETGLDVEVVKLVGVYSKPMQSDIVFSFKCRVTDGKIILNDEADKIRYFSQDKLPMNTVPKQVERINDYFSMEMDTVFKVQVGKTAFDLIKEGKL